MEKFQNSYHSPNYFLMIVSAVTSSSSAVVCGSGRVLSSALFPNYEFLPNSVIVKNI